MDEYGIRTWGDVLAFLQSLTPEELQQPAQVLPPNPNGDLPTALLPLYAAGTLHALGVDDTRDAVTNSHHPHHVVLCFDWNPFLPDGAIGSDLETGKHIFLEDASAADFNPFELDDTRWGETPDAEPGWYELPGTEDEDPETR